jgi:MinD-like ATPase involved in chromosome partitioning or flagellar assembly
MSGEVSIIVGAGGAPWELALLRGLQQPELGVHVLRRCSEHGELLGTALRDRPRAVLLDASVPWLDRDLVATLRDAGVAVVAVGEPSSALDALGVLTVASDASPSALAGIVSSLAPLVAVEAPTAAHGGAGGRLVAVWGATGAPGRTTVAVHLAIESARTGRRTLLVDGDAWAASVAQLLELSESPSVAQAARSAARGWPEPLSEFLQPAPHGLEVLVGLPRAELWPEVSPEGWRSLLDEARDAFDTVVVDVAAPAEEDEELVVDRIPFRRNVMTTLALDLAHRAVLVTTADPIGLRRGILAHRQWSDRPRRSDELAVVLNRLPKSARQSQDCSRAVERWVGGPPTAMLPAEPTFARVVWEGRPLHEVAPRSPWLRELQAVAAELVA